MRISDWSSDVCSSDLRKNPTVCVGHPQVVEPGLELRGGLQTENLTHIQRVVERQTLIAEHHVVGAGHRSEERRGGKSVSVRVDLGGRRIIKKKTHDIYHSYTPSTYHQSKNNTA